MEGDKTSAVFARIMELARTYTPEWHFDEEDMDIGVCFAKVFQSMYQHTGKLYELTFEQGKRRLFNLLHADMRPAGASSGYVSFQLVNRQVPGCYVPKGTKLHAKTEGNAGFETLEDLYVTSAEPDFIYHVSGASDTISLCYTSEDKKAFRLFSLGTENLQKHEMYLISSMFDIPEGGVIEIGFLDAGGRLLQKQQQSRLLEDSKMRIHTTDAGKRNFLAAITEKGALQLRLQHGRTEGNGICFHVCDMHSFLDFQFQDIYICAMKSGIAPSAVYNSSNALTLHEYYPFGEKMGTYQDVIFACNDALCQKGAEITLTFRLSFAAVPSSDFQEKEVEWNWVMKASDFAKEKQYPITIGSVVWEYFNGKGFTRLFQDDSCSDIFQYRKDAGILEKSIHFCCPSDMSLYEGIPKPSFCIRARILSMQNEYKLHGIYYAPVLSDTFFHYEYSGNSHRPDRIHLVNNMAAEHYTAAEAFSKKPLKPFRQMEDSHGGAGGSGAYAEAEKEAVYLGFQNAPAGGPVRFYVKVKNMLPAAGKSGLPNSQEIKMDAQPVMLEWEYLTEKGFRALRITDETEGLQKSGMITFTAGSDIIPASIFQKKLFWLRILDPQGYYTGNKNKPYIEAIHLNTARASAVEFDNTEYFTMKEYEASKSFPLSRQDILKIQVFVEEGLEGQVYTEWKQVKNFSYSQSFDKHFTLDGAGGMITFGNGVNGRIPPAAKRNNIMAVYQCGGGAYTNVEAGAVAQLDKSIGYINKVRNHEAFFGGVDKESVLEAVRRNEAFLKHRGQAVSKRDYELLAAEGSPYIKEACLRSGIDTAGRRRRGCLTLVIVPEQGEEDADFCDALLYETALYLSTRMPAYLSSSGLFRIRLADYVEAGISISVIVKNTQDIYSVKQSIAERIHQYFRSGTGMQIGSLPKQARIKNAVSQIPEVVQIGQMKINYLLRQGDTLLMKNDVELMNAPFIYVVEGIHDIWAAADRG